MKIVPVLIAFVAGVVLLGCGGSGGGGSTTATTSTSGDALTVAIVAESSPGVQVDPTNLQVGDTVIFHLAQIDLTTGTYITLTTSSFTTDDVSGLAGPFNPRTGQLQALHSTNGKLYAVATSWLGKNYSAPYAVTPVQARVAGRLLDTNGQAVQFASVVFFDASSQQVGVTAATVTGAFNASVPVSAVRFNLVPSSLNSSHYYQAFTYGGGTYAPLIQTCSAPLPKLTSGLTSPLANAVVVDTVSDLNGVQNSPPAPPTCSP